MHRWAAIDDKKPWELLADKAKSEYNLKKDVSDRSQSHSHTCLSESLRQLSMLPSGVRAGTPGCARIAQGCESCGEAGKVRRENERTEGQRDDPPSPSEQSSSPLVTFLLIVQSLTCRSRARRRLTISIFSLSVRPTVIEQLKEHQAAHQAADLTNKPEDSRRSTTQTSATS